MLVCGDLIAFGLVAVAFRLQLAQLGGLATCDACQETRIPSTLTSLP
jgi:hypothetical protein